MMAFGVALLLKRSSPSRGDPHAALLLARRSCSPPPSTRRRGRRRCPARERQALAQRAAAPTARVAPRRERDRARCASASASLVPAAGGSPALALRLNPKTTRRGDRARGCSRPGSRRACPPQQLPRGQGRARRSAASWSGSLGAVAVGRLAGAPARARCSAAVGFIVPGRSSLTLRRATRREAIRAQLPDALDLLAVCVEAGLGFDGAVAKLTEHMDGPLVDEFALTLGEMRIGETRQEALKKLAERVHAPEVASVRAARSSRPTSSASRSAGSCACRPPTRASAARRPPRRRR